jgi:glycosyltransferase involved in cell wall biosynthesis
MTSLEEKPQAETASAAAPSTLDIPREEFERGLEVARTQRVAIFVVAYNAEAHIRETLRRIPGELLPLIDTIYVFDDSSADATTERARELEAEIPNLKAFKIPVNQGYGGNQKLGYSYAIQAGFDVVVLLHGDGQYAPEYLPRMIAPFADDEVSAVFGSRMMVPGASKKGGMPFYKRIGNRVLTWMENRLLKANLTEFHSGFRAYRVATMAKIPFSYNTNDFHFDTEVIIQILGSGYRIDEVPIPTYYGDEICRVNGVAYAWNCITTMMRYRANLVYLVHHPKFDLKKENNRYQYKEAETSLHQHVLGLEFQDGSKVLELGAGEGDTSLAMHAKGLKVMSIDQHRPDRDLPFPFMEKDLDGGFADEVIEKMGSQIDVVVALDLIEHLKNPESSLQELQSVLRPGGRLIASTGNIAYIVQRMGLFAGQFNYGKRGILDLTHTRLFTLRSFKRLIEGEGFRIESVRGFGPPIVDMVGNSLVLRVLDRISSLCARVWPTMFCYQFVVVATRLDDLDDILRRTLATGSPKTASDRNGSDS